MNANQPSNDALRDRFLSCEAVKVKGNEGVVIYSDLSALHTFQTVERLTKRIAKTGVSFSVGFRATGYGFLKTSQLGESLMDLLKVDTEEIKECFPKHQFNPYFQVFSSYSDLAYLQYWMAGEYRRFPNTELPNLAEKLNAFVGYIKRELTGGAFKKKMGEFNRVSNKNYRSLSTYTNGLFKRYSKLLVLRVDLGYCKDCEAHFSYPGMLSYDEVKRHHADFLRSLPRYLEKTLRKKSLVGYVWKLEFAPKKSWHYHMIFFLDGQMSREDVTIARLIGEYWKAATGGRGLYYNCNAHKGKYRTAGIGLIDHRDAERRKGLQQAALYLTKTDYYIKVLAPGNGRTFGRGNMPKTQAKRRGRRRQLAVGTDSAEMIAMASWSPRMRRALLHPP